MAARKKNAASRAAKPAKKQPAARKAAKKKAAVKPAKKAAPRRKAAKAAAKVTAKVTSKSAPKKAAGKAAKPAKRRTAKSSPRAAAKPPARKPARKPAAKRAFTPAFDAQRSRAHAKDLLLFELQRARVAVQAALQGVTGGSADRPVRDGGWTIREVVLHLIARDKVRLEEMERTLGGTPASWTGIEGEEMASINEWHLGELRHLDWDAALRLLQTKRDELMAALAAVPAEPAEVWSPRHPFGRMLHALPAHDRHHAAQVKRVRIQGS